MHYFRRVLTHPWLFILPVICAVVAIAVIVAVLLQWSSLQVDRASSHKQEAIVSAALDRNMARIAKDQEAVTVWDDPIVHLNPPDFDWLDANLGIWMHSYYGHDQSYIVSGDDTPVYAMSNSERVLPENYASARNAAGPLIQELRKKLAAGITPVTDDTLSAGAADISVIDGHPAVVSAKPIISDTGDIKQVPGTEAIQISVRYLDGDFIQRLAANFLLDFARFSWIDDRASNEIAVPYRARDGSAVGYLIWSPYLPGTKVRSSMQVALAGALAGIILIISLLVLALRKGAAALRDSEARARHLAEHDTLTDLPNRMFFQEQLGRLLRMASANGTNLALLSLDLDRFKQVNDSLGHLAGDELLRQVARRLAASVRGTDVVARLGGDEFSGILPNVEQRKLDEICLRLLATIHQPFDVLGNSVSIGLSIGVAVAPQDGVSDEELISRSDLALYAAKQRGRGKSVAYTRGLEMKDEGKRPHVMANRLATPAAGFSTA